MSEEHSHTPATSRHLVVTIVPHGGIFLIGLAGGILTNSLALICDSLAVVVIAQYGIDEHTNWHVAGGAG